MASDITLSDDHCGVCESSYQDPRVLSCLHSFCLQCIAKMVEADTNVKCPLCEECTSLPEGDPASLHRNINLNDQEVKKNILRKFSFSTSSQCDLCENEDSRAVAYCTNEKCHGFLCDFCLKGHNIQKKNREHKTITLAEAQKKTQQELMEIIESSFPTPSKCLDHHDSDLDFYCIKCSKPVCAHCVANHHREHSTPKSTGEKISQIRKEIQKSVEGFENHEEKFRNAIEQIESMKNDIDDREAEVNELIENAFTELDDLLSKRKEDLLGNSKSIAEAKRKHLNNQMNTVQSLLNSAHQCHSLATNAEAQYSGVQALAIASPVCDRAAVLKQRFKEVTLDVCETSDISVVVNTGALANQIQVFGTVTNATPCCNRSLTIIPRQKLSVGAEMIVTVISKDKMGNQVNKGGSVVKGRLMKGGETVLQCPVVDNGDGTYLVRVKPTLVEQYQFSLTMHGQDIHGSPFNFRVVPVRQCTITDPLQSIGIKRPHSIAFSESCDLYVTCQDDCCVHVFNSAGQKKYTIGSSFGRNEPLLVMPCGIDVHGDTVYVADSKAHKIHVFAKGGELLNAHGKEGSDVGEFSHPHDVKISPESKIYICDSGNNRVQIFDMKWANLHTINNFHVEAYIPHGLSFDLSCNVHVVGSGSGYIKVFSSSGEFVQEYGREGCSGLYDIAIDAAGNSVVVGGNHLFVFNQKGENVWFVEEFGKNCGISISPSGEVWVADFAKNRINKMLTNYFHEY